MYARDITVIEELKAEVAWCLVLQFVTLKSRASCRYVFKRRFISYPKCHKEGT